MSILLVVRHGECIANANDIVAGSEDDSPLTEKGINEAKGISQTLASKDIGRIISSPLQRTKKTAEIIRDIDFPNRQIETDRRFTERYVGDAVGMPLEDYYVMEKSGKSIKGAETPRQMYDRVKEGLDNLRDVRGTILLVTHNGTYRMIECVLQQRPPEDFSNITGLHNGEIKELRLT